MRFFLLSLGERSAVARWKIPAVFAGFGALISLIAGIAGRIPFGLLALRLLFSLLLAGVLGFAVRYVLERFLPELAGRAKEESAPAVDIVIEDELGLGGSGPQAKATGEAGPSGTPAASALETLPEAELETPIEAVSLAPDVSEPLPEIGGEEEPGSLETLPGAEEEAFQEGSLDSLPDIGHLGPTARAGGSGRFRGELAEAQLDSMVKGQDPESLAKAVRTFLKKDQEG
jgi:hypothetical protein